MQLGRRRVSIRSVLACCIVAVPLSNELPAPTFQDGPTLSQADLLTDFDGWISGMHALNPDLSIRADMQMLERESARIRAELTGPMSRREAWLHFAQLNPHLRDAHAGIQMPDYRGAMAAHLEAGGHVVPIEVRFAPDGSLRVFSVAPEVKGVNPGDRLVSINGHRTDQMLAAMLSRSIGETSAFQHAFVARRFAMFYWYLYGDTGQYDLVVQPAHAFATFKARNARALIVDVRENGGGDDPLWQQDLVNHFTTKPYAQLSHYVVRINKDNAEPGDVIGSVQSADYDKRFTPPSDDPVRYSGPVYILAGPYSYSATIQFLVAAQDFQLAKIAGEETAALACQTGKVKRIELQRSGLSAATPIIAFTRPSGEGCKRGVLPDVPIAINELKPAETLDALLDWIREHG
jgi:hypothetical protein